MSTSPAALDLAQPSPAPTPASPAVDWTGEAQTVAASKAREDSLTTATGSDVAPASKSPFDQPPTHHAGEEFTTASGECAVYVSDNCYQLASPFSYSPNGANNGLGVQTYCKGASHTPRGDLFEHLPAYQKYHTDN